MEYIGQEHLKKALPMIYRRKVAILIGPDRYGKTYFAQQASKELGLNYVLVESNVENAKSLIEEIQPGNFYHLKDLHKARAQVLSRMLKLLEDGVPDDCVIFITTEQQKTIETILSRCLTLKCRRYSYEELKQVKDIDMMLYKVYDSPTKLNDIAEDIDKVIEYVGLFVENADTMKTSDLVNSDIRLVANVLITKLAEKEKYNTIARVSRLVRGFIRNEYIPNWQAVHLLLEEIRDDLI